MFLVGDEVVFKDGFFEQSLSWRDPFPRVISERIPGVIVEVRETENFYRIRWECDLTFGPVTTWYVDQHDYFEYADPKKKKKPIGNWMMKCSK